VTELCSGQALGDADNDAADKSNPYMSPFQGDTIKTFIDVAFDNDQHVNSNTITNFKKKKS
jgi:hypothetical protein